MNRTYFGNYSKQIYNRLDFLIENNAFEGKKIILFGLNSSSYVIKDYLTGKKKVITAFIDNSEKKRKDFKSSYPAYAPEKLKEIHGNDVAILIMSKYYIEMKKQLEGLGYAEDVDFFKVLDVKSLVQYVDFSDNVGMKEIGTNELKQLQLNLLEYMKKVCEANNLKYFLCGGSLIGAVRHKGYIPWDDDIDIIMPYKHYRRFIDIVNSSNNGKYIVLNLYDHPRQYHAFYAKLAMNDTNMKEWDYPYLESFGVNIDIFPAWGFPDDDIEREHFADKLESLHVEFMEEYIKHEKPTEKYFKLQNQILDMQQEYDSDNCTYIGYSYSRHKKKEILPRNIYDNKIMTDFEGKKYPIAMGYQVYLKALFGENYMELPPENERVSTHYFRAFIGKSMEELLENQL